jgi:hypothetical protein
MVEWPSGSSSDLDRGVSDLGQLGATSSAKRLKSLETSRPGAKMKTLKPCARTRSVSWAAHTRGGPARKPRSDVEN